MPDVSRAEPALSPGPGDSAPPPGTGPGGLTSREAERRLLQYGPNEITRSSESGLALELARQFTHPLALLLWAAAGLAALNANATLAVAIVAVIGLNAVLAFLQEVQAEKATEALQRFLPPRVRVRRDAQIAEIDAAGLVPGDVQILGEGDRLSADGRLVDGALELDMAALTGESQAVSRESGAGVPGDAPLDAADRVFAGTLCTAGHAEAEVLATGMHPCSPPTRSSCGAGTSSTGRDGGPRTRTVCGKLRTCCPPRERMPRTGGDSYVPAMVPTATRRTTR